MPSAHRTSLVTLGADCPRYHSRAPRTHRSICARSRIWRSKVAIACSTVWPSLNQKLETARETGSRRITTKRTRRTSASLCSRSAAAIFLGAHGEKR